MTAPLPLILRLADQIVTDLNWAVNANQFDIRFEAVRHYQPKFTLPDIERDVKVCVVPASVTRSEASRGASQQDSEIHVGVLKRVEPNNTGVDPYVALVDSIASFLDGREIPSLQSTVLAAAIDPIFDQQKLSEHKQFTSVIKLTVRSFYS
jgi:hypothetical protein